jgi:hypothetical protein
MCVVSEGRKEEERFLLFPAPSVTPKIYSNLKGTAVKTFVTFDSLINSFVKKTLIFIVVL